MLPLKKFNIFNNPGIWSSKGADAVMIETFYPDDGGIQNMIQTIQSGRLVQVHAAVNVAPGRKEIICLANYLSDIFLILLNKVPLTQ